MRKNSTARNFMVFDRDSYLNITIRFEFNAKGAFWQFFTMFYHCSIFILLGKEFNLIISRIAYQSRLFSKRYYLIYDRIREIQKDLERDKKSSSESFMSVYLGLF